MTMNIAVSLLAILASPAEAGSSVGPRVMVLGTYHMGNPGRDVVKTNIRPTSSPDRQRELEAVVRSLLRWRPTRIAVEVRPENGAAVTKRYQAYRAGTHSLAPDEVEQIAFRLGRALGLEDFCYVDQGGPYPFAAVQAFVKARGPAGAELRLAQALSDMGATAAERDRRFTVGQLLALANAPEELRRGHWRELAIIDAHLGGETPGPALVAAWYERNLRIFANLRRCVARDDERLLVIYGAGHAPLLAQLVRDSLDLTLDPVSRYLPKPPKVAEASTVDLARLYRPARDSHGRQ